MFLFLLLLLLTGDSVNVVDADDVYISVDFAAAVVVDDDDDDDFVHYVVDVFPDKNDDNVDIYCCRQKQLQHPLFVT